MPVLSRKKRVTLLLVGLAAFVWIAHSSYVNLLHKHEEQAPMPPLAKGMLMPDGLTLQTLDAKQEPLADFRGKVVLINFWAGWCGPCLHEMPSLFDLQKRLAPKGFVVLGVNMDDNTSSGMLALKKAAGDPPFPIYHGMGSPLADRFAIEGLPYTVVLDKSFHITYAHAGEVDWNSVQARDLVEGLL